MLFVDLHGYDQERRIDGHTALTVLLRALGVAGDHIPPEPQARELLYRSVLAGFAEQGRRVLVVADNAADLDQVLPLRPGDPAHRMLVTSRHTLPILGARRIEVDVLLPTEAVDVVHQALRAANPADDRIGADPAAASELARLCGYLPLALRISAELLADQPDRAITDLIQDLSDTRSRLAGLAYGDSMAVRAVFDASYRRLPAQQARLFRRLSLNLGPHSNVDTASALLGAAPTTTRRLLDGLRRAHLIRPATTPDSYQFHDLLGIYARERCKQDEPPADQDAAIDRLLDHYRDTAEAANGQLDPRRAYGQHPTLFAGYREALAWLDAERPNLVAAVILAFGCGRYTHARDIPPMLFFFCDLRGHWADWIKIDLYAHTACEAMADQRGEGIALNNVGDGYRGLRKFDEAILSQREALDICRSIDARRDEGTILGNLGNTYYELRQFDIALRYHQQALAICQETNDRYGEGTTLNNLGNTHRKLGQLDAALDSYHQDLLICREIGARRGEGIVLGNLGTTYYEMRRFEEALSHYQQKLTICQDTDDRHGEAAALNNLGSAYHELGQLDEALGHYEQALIRHREASGGLDGAGEIFINLANICHQLQRPDEARRYAAEAAAAFKRTA